MGISIGGIGSGYGMDYIQPLNYNIKNKSEVSDDFLETGMSGAIMNVPPVVYPNAQVVSKDDENDPLALSANVVQKSQEANRMYNDIASRFQNMTVGYDQSSAGTSYGMTGNAIDLMA